MQELESDQGQALRRALDSALDSRRAHRNTLVAMLDTFDPATIVPALDCLQAVAEAPRRSLDGAHTGSPGRGETPSYGAPAGQHTPSTRSTDQQRWASPRAGGFVPDSVASYARGPSAQRSGGLDVSAFAALRVALSSQAAVPGDAAAAAVGQMQTFVGAVATLAQQAHDASCDVRERLNEAALEAAELRDALREERAMAADAARSATERDSDARAARADLAAAAADAAALAETLAAQEAEVLRLQAAEALRRPPPALAGDRAAAPPPYEVLQERLHHAEAAVEAARGAARVAESQRDRAAENAAAAEARAAEVTAATAGGREAAESTAAALEAKDCRIAELRAALAEARGRTDAAAAAAASHTHSSSDALRAAGADPKRLRTQGVVLRLCAHMVQVCR